MMYVKIKRDCILGKKGETVQVADHIGKQRILDGVCVKVSAPVRKHLNNKAMTAPE